MHSLTDDSASTLLLQGTKGETLKPQVSRCVQILKNGKLEILFFIFTFSHIIRNVTTTSLILEKVCVAHFNSSADICVKSLDNHTSMKTKLEAMATNYQIVHSLIQTAPAAVTSCFVGPWSDHYGRKLPMTVATVGMLMDSLASGLCAFNLDSSPVYLLIAAAFTGLTGGMVTVFSAVYSYASDVTLVKQRTFKCAMLELAFGLANTLGLIAGGWIYLLVGYASVFLTSAAGLCICLVWLICVLPETRGLGHSDSWRTKVKMLFSCQALRESFKALARNRPYNGRKELTLLIVSTVFIVISTTSTKGINFIYVHDSYGWGNTKYSTVTAVYLALCLVMVLCLLPVLRQWKVEDAILGIIGTVSLVLKNAGLGLAYKTIVFHAANLCGALSLLAPLAVRSRISKVVSNEELGKVFTFVAISDTLVPVLASVVISQIFNHFLGSFPGMPYIVVAAILMVPFSVFCWLSIFPVGPCKICMQYIDDEASRELIVEE